MSGGLSEGHGGGLEDLRRVQGGDWNGYLQGDSLEALRQGLQPERPEGTPGVH